MQLIKRLLSKLFNRTKGANNWQLQAEAIWKTIKETNATLANTNATLDRVVKEREEFAKEMKKLKERVEGISTGFGRITVGMTLPCVAKAFSEVGIEVFGTEECVKRRDKKIGQEIEIDILSVANKDGKDMLILIECVTYLRRRDVENLIKKTSVFYHFFPEHKDKEFIAAVAYIHAESHAIQLAEEQNYYLITMGENVMEIKNKEITPKIYFYEPRER